MNVTEISAGQFQEMVQYVNINQLLTETDSPYLGPIQGERNTPANVTLTVKKIAELKMPDLNCDSLESAMAMVAGAARSMGLEVRD